MPPEPAFFVDRCLGITFTSGLRERGWRVTSISDVFPNDAQEIGDAEWIQHGGAQGWIALTKDKRIRRSPSWEAATTPIVALADGNLPLRRMVDRFDLQRARIEAAVRSSAGREFWMLYEDRLERTWPK